MTDASCSLCCAPCEGSGNLPAARALGGPYCDPCFFSWQLGPDASPCPACGLFIPPSRLFAHAASVRDPGHLALSVMSA